MWYVRDVLYAVLYVRVSCFVVRDITQEQQSSRHRRHTGGATKEPMTQSTQVVTHNAS